MRGPASGRPSHPALPGVLLPPGLPPGLTPRLIRDAVDVVDAVYGADRPEHVAQVLGVAQLEGELADGDAVPGRGHGRVQDVDAIIGNSPCDIRDHTDALESI